MSNIKKMFALNENSPTFKSLSAEEQTLVKSGVDLVKMYAAKKIEGDNTKSALFSLISDNSIDNYSEYNQKVVNKLCKYALKSAGVEATDENTMDFVRNPQYNKRSAFRETFNAVIAQIMTPMVPAMVSSEFMHMADVSNIALGDTARFTVGSNDVYFVQHQAEGVLSGSVQRLYGNELTVNPEPYSIRTAVDWYDVAAGVFDIGDFVYKVGYSFNAYITQMIVQALAANIEDGIADSSPYFVNGFSTNNFINITERVRAANAGRHVTCWGALSALASVVPAGAIAGNVGNAGLQVGLGEEWAKVGHIGSFMDVDLVRVPQILLPGTVNTDAYFGIPSDTLYFFADGGYKPVKIVFEGQAVTVDILPTEAADKEMGLQVTSRFGHTFVAASKYGAITGAKLSNP